MARRAQDFGISEWVMLLIDDIIQQKTRAKHELSNKTLSLKLGSLSWRVKFF